MVVTRPSGCSQRAWLPRWRLRRNPSRAAARSNSRALAAGIRQYRPLDVVRKLATLLGILLDNHLEDVAQFGASFLRVFPTAWQLRMAGTNA